MPSKPFTVDELRRSFLEFFAEHGCHIHPSASLVPADDPTTLFTVAGMSQFKDMFLGRGSHPFSRATTCQKCLRTNDILRVGRTPRHHTFFEMLGNFSFNDYFKRETIHWAWDYLTGRLGLDPDRLSISVHRIDDEAYRIWNQEVGIPANRLFRLDDADNFWPASAPAEGPTGPGGCCSEIFWDYRTNNDPKDNLAGDTGRFVEIWNLVFPQFNVTEPKVDGRYTLQDLGRCNIDTGSGLERLACVIQGKTNNFDIDNLQIIVQGVVRIAEQAYAEGATEPAQAARNVLLRRIADHVRAVSFCIADGALPGNVGRGYVVRRLVRRATLDLDALGMHEARLARVVEDVIKAMGGAYPELPARRELIIQALEAEEKLFRRTLARGQELLHRALARHRAEGRTTFSGDDCFELFTTFGFPPEVTEDLIAVEGLTLDRQRFEQRMRDFAEISKGGRTVEVFAAKALVEACREPPTVFVGYDRLNSEARLVGLETAGVLTEAAPAGTEVRFALDRTPFYAESGGQVADLGLVTAADGSFEIQVTDVQKDGSVVLHSGKVLRGTAKAGAVRAQVEAGRRAAITRHHSATHLLQSALRSVVGTHLDQQGSRVDPECLRFDFNHGQALTREQTAQVEAAVAQAVAARLPVAITTMDLEEARAQGARALFGEKYGAQVRVVRMGEVSMELCGGCHVANTGDLGGFRVVREEAVAAGVRRITAVAGAAAATLNQAEAACAQACARALGLPDPDAREIGELTRALKCSVEELPARIQALADEARQLNGGALPALAGNLSARLAHLQQELKQLRKKSEAGAVAQAEAGLLAILAQPQTVAGVPIMAGELPVDGKVLRELADSLKKRSLGPYCVVLGSRCDAKASLVAAVSPELVTAGLKAGEVIGRLAPLVGGRGGGRPDQAQGGGPDATRLGEALAAVPGVVAAILDGGGKR